MSLNMKTLALARDIEQAFKNHLNTDSFPTAEWPNVALEFAKTIEATAAYDWTDEPRLEFAQALVRQLAALNNAIVDLVGL